MNNYEELVELSRQKDFFKETDSPEVFFKKKKFLFKPADFCAWFEQLLIDQIFEFGKLQYLYFQKADAFGEAGELRTAISFCRALYQIPASSEVTQLDANRFQDEMAAFDEKHKFPEAKQLENELKNLYFYFGKTKVMIEDYSWVNQVLEWLGSPHRYSHAFLADGWVMRFGKQKFLRKVRNKKIGDFDIVILETELARTPLAYLSIAASNFETHTMVRKVSCETIFYNKWHSFYQTERFEREWLWSHDYSNIREMIKLRALKAYQYQTLQDLEKDRERFVLEMIEGIVWHEIGHAISLRCNPTFEKHHEALVSALSNTSNYSAVVLKEALADWAEEFDGMSGPILYLANLAEKDYAKAKRMLYVYLSDYWFLDVGEEFMGKSTDIIVALLMPFIASNGEINFKKMKEAHAKLYPFLSENFRLISDLLLKILDDASFKMSEHMMVNFTYIKKQIASVLRPIIRRESKMLEECEDSTFFWQSIFSVLKSLSPESHKKFHQQLSDFNQILDQKLLLYLSEWDSMAAQCIDLRTYVIESMKRIDFYFFQGPSLLEERLNQISYQMKLTAQKRTQLIQIWKELASGEKELALEKEAKASLLLASLQKMLQISHKNYKPETFGLMDAATEKVLKEVFEADPGNAFLLDQNKTNRLSAMIRSEF